MMLLFVHDHPFYKELDIIYSGGGLPYTIWDDYLVKFNEVFVYGRYSENLKDKKVRSSTGNVSFFLTDKYTSPVDLIKKKREIKQELESLIEKADVVLVRLPSVLGFIAGLQAFKMKKRVWVQQVGNAKEAFSTHGSLLGKVIAPFFEFQNKKIVSKADFVTYVTDNKLQRDYPPNSNALTEALSDVVINNILGEKDLKKERFLGKSFKIGLIGGFDVMYKGQDILLNAIYKLEVDIKKNVKICLVGKGDYSWILALAEELGLKENIEYIGSLESGAQINNFLSSLSLYVQPSLTEGMPRSIIEAMAMGCPVIGSNVGGIPDVVSSQFVHKSGNVKELRNHIRYLYSDRYHLCNESILSLKKSVPYLKTNLDKKRMFFYSLMKTRLNMGDNPN